MLYPQDLLILSKMEKIALHPELFIVEDFFTNEQCNSFLKFCEAKQFEEAKINVSGNQIMNKGVRNNDRHLFFDKKLANELWSNIEQFVPKSIGMYEALGLNEMFRIYKYSKGQRFKMHRDGSYVRNETECSFLSFLIYLNEDFEGGETEFRKITTIQPKKGMALIFHHPLRHEGKEIISGTKYVLRTDIMYKLNKS